ncbi:hypothetical protein [Streptomyces sp. NPDC051561]|uniref:hypothetical protein n=1 Tax=Streptomyces sp. NPDC051561 TaxID=3365658 RepID=UPI0037AD18DD
MQSLKRTGRSESGPSDVSDITDAASYVAADSAGPDPDSYDTFEMFRVICPDCVQPIALLAGEDVLPEHAKCPTPWNPFGLTACSGTGRPAADAGPADETTEVQEQDTALLLTLPQGLDWRTQPFSHVGGPGSRPLKVPRQRAA